MEGRQGRSQEYRLGGPGCNRNMPNIIFKSIGYKTIFIYYYILEHVGNLTEISNL